MVFQTLKDSLTSFTDKVTNPLDTITEVTSTMKNTVIGPNANMLEVVHTNVFIKMYATALTSYVKSMHLALGKTKIAAGKKKELQAFYSSLQTTSEDWHDVRIYTKELKSITSQVQKAISEKQLPNEYTGGAISYSSSALTEKDIDLVLPLVKKKDTDLQASLATLDKPLADQLLLPFVSAYDWKKESNVFRKNWKKQISALIDNEYSITKQQKQLLYSVEELQRQTTLLEKAESEKRKGSIDKDLVRRMNAAKQKIEVLTKKDLPGLFMSVEKANTLVATNEKNIITTWDTYEKNDTTYNTALLTWFQKNLATTKKTIAAENKKQATGKKQLTVLTKKCLQTHASLDKLGEKSTALSSHEAYKKLLSQESAYMQDLHDKEIATYGSYLLQMSSHQKDILAGQTVLHDTIDRTYISISLGKERILQLKILLSNKKRHANTGNTILSTLTHVAQTTSISLTGSIVKAKKQAEAFKKQTIAYEKEIGEHTKEIRAVNKFLKEIHAGTQANAESKEWLAAAYGKAVLTSYISILEILQKSTKSHVSTLKNTFKNLSKMLESAKKEAAYFSKREHLSPAEKKQLVAATKIVHEGELLIDMIEHHLTYENEVTQERDRLVKAYKKQSKWEDKKVVFYKKLVTKLYDKVAKNTVCKSAVRSPKNVQGISF